MTEAERQDSPIGGNPATAALALLLTQAGLTGPVGGAQTTLSEPMVLGVAGGLGAGVFSFRYDKEDVSTFFVAGRHLWQDDFAYVRGVCDRLGVETVVRETNGAKAARTNLVEALDGGRSALVWVDMACLPYRGMPKTWEGGGYHVVVVHEVDETASTVTLYDQVSQPITLPLDQFDAARARIKKQKNRVLTLETVQPSVDWPQAIHEGLRACREGLVGGRMKNFRLEAFESWADRLAGNRSKEGWERLFPPGKHLWTALTSTYDFIEHYGTGGGLVRPLFSRFLAEAGEALDDSVLTSLAERYAEIGEGWRHLAQAALPTEIDQLAEARRLLDEKADLFRQRGAAAEADIRGVGSELTRLASDCAQAFPLDESGAADLRSDLQQRLRTLVAAERQALDEIGSWLAG